MLDDPKIDVAIISTAYIQQTGLSPAKDSVFIEDKNSPYVNILVAREDNKEPENVKEYLASYQSREVVKAAETLFNSGRYQAGKSHANARVIGTLPSYLIVNMLQKECLMLLLNTQLTQHHAVHF